LYQNLSDVVDYLAELKYIDDALSYLEGRDDPRAWVDPPLYHLFFLEYDIAVGDTFPFTRTIRMLDPRFGGETEPVTMSGPVAGDQYEGIVNDLTEIKVWAAKWGRDNLDSLTEMIAEITHPVSGIYEQSVIEPLRTAHTTLQDGVRTDVGKLGYTIEHWRGDAASNFRTNFYDTWGDMRTSQERVFEALVGGLSTVKAIEESSQHSLMNAIHYLRELLREQLELRQRQGNADARGREINPLAIAKAITILAGGGASVVGAAVGSKLWAIGMETAVAGLSFAESTIPDGVAAPFTLQGKAADDLLGTLLTAIDGIKRNAGVQYDSLDEQLGIVLDRVELLRDGPDPDGEDGDDGRLFPIRPQLVGGVDSDIFRHDSSGSR
jgi:hypothetical protein